MEIMYANPMIDLNELPPAESSGEVAVHSPSNSQISPVNPPVSMANTMTKKRKRKTVSEMTKEEKDRIHARDKIINNRRYTKMKAFQNSEDPKEREIGNKFFIRKKQSKEKFFAGIKERKQQGIMTNEDLERTQRKAKASAQYHQQHKERLNAKKIANRRKEAENRSTPVRARTKAMQKQP